MPHMRLLFLSALLGLGVVSGCDESSTGSSDLRIIADERGYTPSSITIKRGTSATIQFMLTTDQTCAQDLVIPDLKIEKKLPLNVPVNIEIPASEPRTYGFECGMKMFKGSIIVE